MNNSFFNSIFTNKFINEVALDLFARDGTLATTDWANFFNRIDACDIRQDYLVEYKKNWPQAKTYNIDSIKNLKSGTIPLITGNNKYNFIAIDNPLGSFGVNYHEHYNFLKDIPPLLASQGYLYFNINLNPYNPERSLNVKDNYGMGQESYREYLYEREKFYGKITLTISEAIKFYIDFFSNIRCEIKMAKWHLRKSVILNHPDHVLYILMQCN